MKSNRFSPLMSAAILGSCVIATFASAQAVEPRRSPTVLPAVAPASGPLRFSVSFDKAVAPGPVSGRIVVFVSKRGAGEPRRGPNWFQPEPMFAVDVRDFAPGAKAIVDDAAISFPEKITKLPAGAYTVQAVLDFGLGREVGTQAGNGFSKPVKLELDPQSTGPVELHIDQIAVERPFRETERVKLFEIESKLLTAFHGRRVMLRAGVALPRSIVEGSNAKATGKADKKFPVVYEIPGFGGDHFGAFGSARSDATQVAGVEMIHVVLDPECPTGHHVFADSENNGPCGRALVEELIPGLEAKFPALGKPEARFVTGHSSGGWSSLWLQVTYAESFGGVWSTAPDPVAFNDFQRIDIYRKGENMFVDPRGDRRPIARFGNRPLVYYKSFSDMEEPLGHGGQLASFEAVFSPKGPDGKPRKLWDRATGKIDAAVAKTWEKYDIRLQLERNWSTLAPKLAGKLHVYMGDTDTFYLEGATRLLQETLQKLGGDAKVELFAGKDHGSLMDRSMRQRIAGEMAAQYRKAFPEKGPVN